MCRETLKTSSKDRDLSNKIYNNIWNITQNNETKQRFNTHVDPLCHAARAVDGKRCAVKAVVALEQKRENCNANVDTVVNTFLRSAMVSCAGGGAVGSRLSGDTRLYAGVRVPGM